jgi:3',5'-nucleoside bisphosphate phosphatase
LKTYRAELHVHTALSPCAEVEMIPPLIVQEAQDRGINLIAITDHNATANIGAVQKAAVGSDLMVLPGMELQTREEVHVLCLFDSLEQVNQWQQIIDGLLPSIENQPDHFGEQFVVDETGDFIRREPRLLLTSANISIDDALTRVTDLGGLMIPAHIDRRAFGLMAVLGFVPFDLTLEAVEISRNITPAEAKRKFPQSAGYPMLQGGDAHRLDEFMGLNQFELCAPTIAEIRLALKQQEGRSFRLNPISM